MSNGRLDDSGPHTPGWGATIDMGSHQVAAVSSSTLPSPTAGSASTSPISSPVVIGGIAAAAAVVLGLLVWLSCVLCRSKRAAKRARSGAVLDDEGGPRPKLPADWNVADHRAKSPPHAPRAHSPQAKPSPTIAQQFAFPHNAPKRVADPALGTGSQASSSRAKSPQLPSATRSPQMQPSRLAPPSHPISPSAVGKPQPLPHLFSRPLSRDEFRILDEHKQAGTLPQPFTKLQPADVTRIERAVRNRGSSEYLHQQQQMQQMQQRRPADPLTAALGNGQSSFGSGSKTSSKGAPPSAYARKKLSVVSSRSKHQSGTSVASSFSFASMPYRNASSVGALDDADADSDSPYSVAGTVPALPNRSAVRIQPGFHVAKVAFSPLLPDEVELRANERVTVVDVYNDGWCIVMRNGGEDVVMGAVPMYCFTEQPTDSPTGFERTRPERKASLGVTVELETGDDDAGDDAATDSGRTDSRHDSVFSWSNF